MCAISYRHAFIRRAKHGKFYFIQIISVLLPPKKKWIENYVQVSVFNIEKKVGAGNTLNDRQTNKS